MGLKKQRGLHSSHIVKVKMENFFVVDPIWYYPYKRSQQKHAADKPQMLQLIEFREPLI